MKVLTNPVISSSSQLHLPKSAGQKPAVHWKDKREDTALFLLGDSESLQKAVAEKKFILKLYGNFP
jgi:hypothetical protein